MMDDAYDDITKLIHWGQSLTNGLTNDELFSLQRMRTDMLYVAYEGHMRTGPVHEFHDNGTDPGNCCYCHTFHRDPAYRDGTPGDVLI